MPEALARQVDTTAVVTPLVDNVQFTGNEVFPDAKLRLYVRTVAIRRFLGIPGFRWWWWLYRLGDSGKLGHRIGEALKSGGEPPAYFDPALLASDVERLRLFYQQEGFRQAHISTRVDTTYAGRYVDVTFVIKAGAPTFIRDVRYEGIDVLRADEQRRLVHESLLHPGGQALPEANAFRAIHQRYSEPTLLEERRRLLTFLRNRGHAALVRDSIRALIYPRPNDSLDVVFRIRPGPRFRFGDLRYDVSGPEETARQRADTLVFDAPNDSVRGGVATVRIHDESRLSPGVLTRTLQFRPGEWYDQSEVLATKRRLEATGLFVFSDITPLMEDTSRAAPGAAPRLPHHIELRTRQRHSIRLETFMLQRSGAFGGSDSELGTGIGVSYANANLLGRGETFSIRTTGSISADIDSTLFTSAQAEIVASLVPPYLVWPFGRLERALDLYDARTRFSLSWLTARRADLGLIIRGRGNGRFRLEMQHSPTVTSLFDVMDLSISNPDTTGNFEEHFLSNLLGPVRDPVQRAQVLEDYTQPQINSAMRYTLRSSRVNPLRRERGYSYEASVEVGNNLMWLLDRFVFTPGTVEESLPGLPFFRGGRRDNRLIYRQYVRFIGDFRRYKPLNSHLVLAGKFFVGFAQPTGRADVVPFDRRFYSGGASSIRGWSLRDLGPGSARFLADADTMGTTSSFTNILGGDVKLEASVELRNTIVRNILAADWIGVAFVDAGNVWFGPRNPGFGARAAPGADGRFRFDSFYRELGVGSGMGIRIGWEYLIVRFDLAVRVYDPVRASAGLLPDGLRHIHPHFGIGHTF